LIASSLASHVLSLVEEILSVLHEIDFLEEQVGLLLTVAFVEEHLSGCLLELVVCPFDLFDVDFLFLYFQYSIRWI